VLGLDGNATGSLESSLFGASADGIGTVNGEVAVSFSPQGKPETLEVAASGDGVWKVGPAEPKLDLPEPPANGGGASSSNNTSSPGTPASGNPTAGSGGAPSSGSPGESAPKPTLSIDSSSSDGSGVGSSFVGTLDLADNPQAEQDVESVLHGDPSKISAVINDLNTSGTETVQTYRIDRSNSSVGAKWSEGVGLGGHITDGTSSATYDPPMTRQDGGPWLSAAH
jgi:hypothetical protein